MRPLVYALLVLVPAAAGAITVGQVDDFESGPAGWSDATASGGETGPDDDFLQVDPPFAVAGEQWHGDYLAAGVEAIALDIRAATPGSVQLLIAGGPEAVIATSPVPIGTEWTRIVFWVTPDDFMEPGAEDVLANVFDVMVVLEDPAPFDLDDVEAIGAPEDCANGADDNGAGGADCADPVCAGDAFCDPCTVGFSFETGPGGWAAGGLWAWDQATGSWGAQTEDGEGRLTRAVSIPPASEAPRSQLEIVYRLESDGDTFAVCLNQPACEAGDALYVGAHATEALTPPNFVDEDGNAHVFVDVGAAAGTTADVTLLFDGVDSTGTSGVRVFEVVLGSDVDRDGDYEGAAGACDPCWDADGDGYVAPLSPGAADGCPHSPETDCDDSESQINPGASEICGLPGDEDCDGLINGQDVGSCGVEDCANGQDDNGDGLADCADASCTLDPYCDVCGRHFTFESGPGGWTPVDPSGDQDPDNDPGSFLFAYGASDAAGGAFGWGTVPNGLVEDADTTGQPRIQGWLVRTVQVPAGTPAPVVEVRYSLRGDDAPGRDVFGVCLNAVPSQCHAGAPPGLLSFSTSEDTTNGLDTAVIEVPPALAGQSVSVVLFYDTVDDQDNDNPGLFIGDVLVRSDLDSDGQYENADQSCDHCVDEDGDEYARSGIPPAYQQCNEEGLDCADGDPLTNPGVAEECSLAGDQDCNGLEDDEEAACSECGDGEVTAGETCDDGGQSPGDGCDAACQVEPGALILTEVHVTIMDPGARGEQWVELYNRTGAPLDLAAMGLALQRETGGPLSLATECATLPGRSWLVQPNDYFVLSLGDISTADGLDADAHCPAGSLQLDPTGDSPSLRVGGTVVDAVTFGGFGCEVDRARAGDLGRSLTLLTPTSQDETSNDSADQWCLAGPGQSYATSGNHLGSPGAAGGCAELACDGADDDCDGDVDESLVDGDEDGLCDDVDCDPGSATCTTDCVTDADADGTPDCRDGCLDQDDDGWGVSGGALESTCQTKAGQPAPDCDDTLSFVNPGAAEVPGGACTNGVDDNCDGRPDCTDPACGAAAECAGEACAGAEPIACGQLVTVEPITRSFPCAAGEDAVLRFSAKANETVTLEVDNLGTRRYGAYVREGTCTDLACAGTQSFGSTCGAGGSGQISVAAGKDYFIVLDVVDSCAGSGSGEVSVRVRCAEVCDGAGLDDDGDGQADCLDADCTGASLCADADFDGDGATNGEELVCGTNPATALSAPSADDLLDPDEDEIINCADDNDDDDPVSDAGELAQCTLNGTARVDAGIYPGGPKNCDKVGVDADCNGAFDTQEDACGAVEQQCGDGEDNDVDGDPDCADVDCVSRPICAAQDKDGDGVPNGIEVQCKTDPTQASSVPTAAQAADLEPDGLPNCADPDDDGDGFADVTELLCGSDPLAAGSVPVNTDGDGQCDAADPDDDNDGFADALETDCGSDPLDAGSTPVDAAHDLDGDATCDARDPDRDGDGWDDAIEDACGTSAVDAGDNPPLAGLDDDNDEVCDALDADDDNDGWPDDKESLCGTDPKSATSVPADVDLDQVCDQFDEDTDGDGWPDQLEQQCGTDPQVSESNPTTLGQDQDDDKLCDKVDSDDDGDGWSDLKEAQCNRDPLDPSDVPVDTDGDLLCNAEDTDDDGDGAPDQSEALCGTDPLDVESVPVDEDGDGKCDALDPGEDPDEDGWTNLEELTCGTLPLDAASVPVDTDEDEVCDVTDTDDDGDGWKDGGEQTCGTDPLDGASTPVDTDGDTLCNAIDTDDDGDGSPDADEVLCGTDPADAGVKPLESDLADTDGDGDVNCVDDDDDGDGIFDADEAQSGSNPLVVDTDGDGLHDGDEDLDKDGVLDATETSPTRKDTDSDGLHDGQEAVGCYLGDPGAGSCQSTEGYTADTDGDGLVDGLEDLNQNGLVDPTETNPLVEDTDNDGFSDGEEVACASNPRDAGSVPLDLDGSGTCDGAEKDTDGDGVPDGLEGLCGTDAGSAKSKPSKKELSDDDADDVLDCVDSDDDDDGIDDADELVCGTNPLDAGDAPEPGEVLDTDGDGALDCADTDDDNDGLADLVEVDTDPKDADTDDDGLSDGAERNVHGTSPTEPDTDGDGVQDGTEVGETLGTPQTDAGVFQPDQDPTTATDPRDEDTDNDGLTDGEEDLDANGRFDEGETDPLASADGLMDSDGDTLPDWWETDPDNPFPTDPEKPDTDGDGLGDEVEVRVTLTDPRVADTDGGGVIDGHETANGTDPLEPSDDFAPAQIGGSNVFGCTSSGSGSSTGGLWVLALLALALLVRRRGLGMLVLGLALAAPEVADAQRFTGTVNTQNFFPSGGRHRVWSVEESLVGAQWQPYAHVLFTGERESLQVEVGRYREILIDFRTTAELNLGVGLWDVMQLELALPAVLQWETGDNVQTVAAASGAAVGDLLVRVRGTLLDNRTGGFGVGLSVGATFPTATGDGARFAGDPGVGVLANTIFDYRASRVVLALNAGVRVRTEDVVLLNETFSHELTYGLGVDVTLWRRHIDLGVELFGRTPLLEPFQAQKTTSLEVLGGPKWWIYEGLVMQAAAGAGLVKGQGAPDFRFTVGLGWAPQREDSDGDGVADERDHCPLVAEDPDGYADTDGCPDDDNDGDGIADAADRCPNAAEDVNGIDDDDGCPDADSDGDGVADSADRCPGEREDADGFADDDGCPELDNDEDGILDSADRCPLEAETRNGFEDDDGCPDEAEDGEVRTVVVEKRVKDADCQMTLPRVFFAQARANLDAEARAALLKAVELISARQAGSLPRIETLEISGHASQEGTDETNLALSKRRADAVRAFLVKQGVPVNLVIVRSFGEAAPLVDKTHRQAIPKNRRVDLIPVLGGKCTP